MNFKTSGIKSTRDAFDIAALTCRIPSFISDDDRNFLAIQLVVKPGKFLLKSVKLGFVFIIRYGLIQRDLRQFRCLTEREHILKDRNRLCSAGKRCVDSVYEDIKKLNLRPFFVFCIDDVPGRLGLIGLRQIFFIDIQAFLIMLILPFIEFADSPLRILVFGQLLYALFLLFFVYMEKELKDQIPVIRKLSFEILDAGHAGLILCIGQFPAQVFAGHFLHPAPVKKLIFSGLGDLHKMSVKERFA